jgi:hypothetical protein
MATSSDPLARAFFSSRIITIKYQDTVTLHVNFVGFKHASTFTDHWGSFSNPVLTKYVRVEVSKDILINLFQLKSSRYFQKYFNHFLLEMQLPCIYAIHQVPPLSHPQAQNIYLNQAIGFIRKGCSIIN